MTIGITGTIRAGKGTLSKALVDEYEFVHLSVRGYIIQSLVNQGINESEITRTQLVNEGNRLRTANNDPAYIVKALYLQALEISRESGKSVIIESLRCPGEVTALREFAKELGGFELWGVDADVKLRWERDCNEGGQLTLDEFIKQDEREASSDDPFAQNLKACWEMADVKFDNSKSVDDFKKEIDTEVKRLRGIEMVERESILL
ncbi:MAG: hypothetical protein Fur003_5780 [Candidatus Dojkabacteria bacterium]